MPEEDPVLHAANQVCRRIRELRAERGWALEHLASASGVSRSMLSQIERERANPTLAVTLRIAHAFDMSLSELVEASDTPPRIDVIRADDQRHMFRSDDDCRIRTLSPLNLEKDVEFYEVWLREGGILRSAPHFEGTREFVTVESGEVRLESGETTAELSRGDSASYRADLAHSMINTGSAEAVVFLVVIYASMSPSRPR